MIRRTDAITLLTKNECKGLGLDEGCGRKLFDRRCLKSAAAAAVAIEARDSYCPHRVNPPHQTNILSKRLNVAAAHLAAFG